MLTAYQPIVAAMLTVAVASIGLLGAALTVAVNRQLERRRLFAEQLAIAYDRFAGGSQKRSAGIASLDGLRESSPNLWKIHRSAVTDFTVAQAVYLLEHGDSRFKAHELANLHQLLGWIDPLRNDQALLAGWQVEALRAAIDRFGRDAGSAKDPTASLATHKSYFDEVGARLGGSR